MSGVRSNAKGSAEAATSPSHGSNNPNQENAVNSDTHSTAAASPATDAPPMRCPTLPLADRLTVVRFMARMTRDAIVEAGGMQGDTFVTYNEKVLLELEDEERHLRLGLSMAKASSLEGAAVQIAEAITVEDGLFESIPGDERGEWLESQRRTLIRLLFSAMEAIERHCGRPVSEIVDDRFAEPHTNPWTPVDERLALVQDLRDHG